jgi:hypothetical protein
VCYIRTVDRGHSKLKTFDIYSGGVIRQLEIKVWRLLTVPGPDEIANSDQPRGTICKLRSGDPSGKGEGEGGHRWLHPCSDFRRRIVSPPVLDFKQVEEEVEVGEFGNRLLNHPEADLLVDSPGCIILEESKGFPLERENPLAAQKFGELDPGNCRLVVSPDRGAGERADCERLPGPSRCKPRRRHVRKNLLQPLYLNQAPYRHKLLCLSFFRDPGD